MARIRRMGEGKAKTQQAIWKVGKYIRLSREDGNDVSESVVNQDKILTAAIPQFFEEGMYEAVDIYIDACAIIALTGKTLAARGVAPF